MPPKTGNRKLAGAKNTSQKTIEALEEIEERNPTATAKADDAKPALDGIKSPPNGVDPGNPDPKGKRDSKHIFEGLGDLMDINFNKNASLPTNVFKTAHPEGGPKLTQEEILKQKSVSAWGCRGRRALARNVSGNEIGPPPACSRSQIRKRFSIG